LEIPGFVKLAPWFGVGGMVVAFFIYLYISKQDEGNEKMKELAKLIHDGAMVFLKREYTILLGFIIVVTSFLYMQIAPQTALAYVAGLNSIFLSLATLSTTINPKLCLVPSYSAPGFPNPIKHFKMN